VPPLLFQWQDGKSRPPRHLLFHAPCDETGQIFTEGAIQKAFELTGGQPWLVNALAAQVVEKILQKDYSVPVTVEHILQAKEELILRRDTHLDSLAGMRKAGWNDFITGKPNRNCSYKPICRGLSTLAAQ